MNVRSATPSCGPKRATAASFARTAPYLAHPFRLSGHVVDRKRGTGRYPVKSPGASPSRRRRNRWNAAGITSIESSGAVIIPPIMGAAILCMTSDPVPCLHMNFGERAYSLHYFACAARIVDHRLDLAAVSYDSLVLEHLG